MIRRLAVAAFAVASLFSLARPARATIVERVVAVVGDRPILLTELRHRAKPNLLRIAASGRDENFRAAAESETFKEVLNRMIDERLEESAAEKARIQVGAEQIDRGIQNIAANAKVTVPDVLAEVRRQGLTEQEFRDEIRRQVLEGQLIELRVRPRVRVTEQDARAAYQHFASEMGEQRMVDLHVLALQLQAGRRELAKQLVDRARGGENFCDLVMQFSDDVQTRPTCGSRGPQPIQNIAPAVREALTKLKPMQISEPIEIAVPGGGGALLIVQPQNELKVPAFEEVKNEMMQRALIEGLERQRRLWLQEMRRGVYIDVRL